MAICKVLQLPDPILTTVAVPVLQIDEKAQALALDLIDTMRASPACVGLAAPQIGVGLRAFVVDVTGHTKAQSCNGAFVLFNPVILSAEGLVTAREGCMSVPALTGDVSRAINLVVSGLTPDGSELTLEVNAFEARAVLHEIDHLNGLVFLNRVVSRDRVFPRRMYR